MRCLFVDGRRQRKQPVHQIGSRPKQGAIVLNIVGELDNPGEGNFFEGVMTAGYSTDAADEAVQASVVAAGYGR